jgi:hypothetical protein
VSRLVPSLKGEGKGGGDGTPGDAQPGSPAG